MVTPGEGADLDGQEETTEGGAEQNGIGTPFLYAGPRTNDEKHLVKTLFTCFVSHLRFYHIWLPVIADNELVVFRHHLHFTSRHESQLLPVRSSGRREQESWSVLGKAQAMPLR